MRFKKKRFAIIGGILAAFVLTVGIIAGITNKKEEASAASGSNAVITIGKKIPSASNYITNDFSLKIDGVLENKNAWCGYGDWGSGRTPGGLNNGGTVTRAWESYAVDENSENWKKIIFKIMYYGELNSDDYSNVDIHKALGKARGKYSGSSALYNYAYSAPLPDKDNMTVYFTYPSESYPSEQYIYTYSFEEKKVEPMYLTVKKEWDDGFDSNDYPDDLEIHVSITRTDGTNPITDSGSDDDRIDLTNIVLNKKNGWTQKYVHLKAGQEFTITERLSDSGFSEARGVVSDVTLYQNEKLKRNGNYVYYKEPTTSCDRESNGRDFVCTAKNSEKDYANIRLFIRKHWEDEGKSEYRTDGFYFYVRAFTNLDNPTGSDVSQLIGQTTGKIFNASGTQLQYVMTAQNSDTWAGYISGLPKNIGDANVYYAISEDPESTPINYRSSCETRTINFNDGHGEYCLQNEGADELAGNRNVEITNNLEYVELEAIKTWNDGGNDQKRPYMIMYDIYRDGVYYSSEVIANPRGAGYDTNVWTNTTLLPEYAKDGHEYVYTYKEFDFMKEWWDSDELSGNYFLENAEDGSMVNTAKMKIPVVKCFRDNDQTKRPRELDFELFSNKQDGAIENLTLTSADENKETGCWEGEFDNLPAYDEDGEEIIYRVEEDTSTVDNYVLDEDYAVCEINAGENFAADDEDKQSCTFYNVELVDIPVKKVWAEDTKEDRPGSIEVSLLCGDNVLDTVTLSEANNLDGDNTWEYTWKNRRVDECEQGYSVAENINIPGYATKITGNAEDGFVITNTKTLDTIVTWGSVGAGSFGALAAGFFVAKRKLFGR